MLNVQELGQTAGACFGFRLPVGATWEFQPYALRTPNTNLLYHVNPLEIRWVFGVRGRLSFHALETGHVPGLDHFPPIKRRTGAVLGPGITPQRPKGENYWKHIRMSQNRIRTPLQQKTLRLFPLGFPSTPHNKKSVPFIEQEEAPK